MSSSSWAVSLLPPIRIDWTRHLFALRMIAAVIASLAIAFWLQVDDPQWAGLTACLVMQPTAGAVVAKSAYRVVGTVIGSLFGLFALALYAEAPIAFVALMVAWLGATVFGAMRARNFVAYGCLLAGYSGLLVGFQAVTSPEGAWAVALNRTIEILIGIGCSTVVTLLVKPVYAGDVLHRSVGTTFSGLAAYAAKALDPATPPDELSATRQQMVQQVATFDALRSYTTFEAMEMRADDGALRHVVRDFLGVLSVARSLYVRLQGLRQQPAGPVLDHVSATLAEVAAILQAVSAETRDALVDPQPVRRDLLHARQRLLAARGALVAMVGSVPFDELANALLVISRTRDMVHRLSMVMVASFAVNRRRRRQPHLRAASPPFGLTEAILQSIRAALALLIVTVFWIGTAWGAGFSSIIGLVVVLFCIVNQDDPGKIVRPYIAAVTLALVLALAATATVLPRLEDFAGLAIFLGLALYPAGLAMATPKYALAGAGFGVFFIAELITGNRFQPVPQQYVNNAFGLLVGMVACLIAAQGLLPVSPEGIRRRVWRRVLAVQASAARGTLTGFGPTRAVFGVLAGLLPRLDLARPREEELLRGCLGAGSNGIELA
ncbi:MAG: FUSC family protein, partial [Proteobacteria bacterium]|nr:FUSC family protein [Pseudomonadota bacterium]